MLRSEEAERRKKEKKQILAGAGVPGYDFGKACMIGLEAIRRLALVD